MKNEKIMYLVLGLVLGFALTFAFTHFEDRRDGMSDDMMPHGSNQQNNDANQPAPMGSVSGTFALPGEHCGGNMSTALACGTGYHCAATPGSHLPFGDVGGTCIKD